MKVIDVIIKRIISDLLPESIELEPTTSLKEDLNLTDEDLDLIRQRMQLIFDIKIPEDSFASNSTYEELCEFVLSVFNEHEVLKKISSKS